MSPQGKDATDADEPSAEALLLHDVRGALADILGGLELLEAPGLPRHAVQQLDRVRASALQLARLISQLERSRAEPDSGEGQPHPGSVVLTALLPAILNRWRGTAAVRGIAFSHDIALPEGLAVAIDPLAFERAINNLIDNALKYGAGAPVSVRAEARGSAVTITVRDAGPGVAPEAASEMLRPGARGGAGEGSGFGLHIAKKAVEGVGGSLHFGPNPEGRGMEARIEFPLCAASRIARAPAAPAALPRPLAGRTALVVEDNETNRLVVTEMLERLGAGWKAARDGLEGLAALAQDDFDVVLVDIEMPRLGGIEMIRRMRAHSEPRIAGVPALAITAYGLPQHRRAIVEAGADGVILKPVDDVELFGVAVARVLRSAFDPARLSELRAQLGREGYARLADTLSRDLGGCLDLLRRASDERDTERLRRATHNLVALGGVVGADALAAASRGLNLMLHADTPPTREEIEVAAQHLVELVAEVRSVVDAGLREEEGGH